MFKFYITTVIVYMIILYCECKVFKSSIVKNGWGTEGKKEMGALSATFCYSAIPVFRFFIAVVILVMAIYPKEKVMAWIEENKKGE